MSFPNSFEKVTITAMPNQLRAYKKRLQESIPDLFIYNSLQQIQTKFTLKSPSGSIEANQEQDKRCTLSILLLT